MIHILGILGFILLLIIVFLLILVLSAFNMVRNFLGLGRKTSRKEPFSNAQNNRRQQNGNINTDETPSRHKKVFSSDEGEYIDFKED